MHIPKINIIVPAYNAEVTLPRCIESLLRQTFQDFEIILIDDCCKDQSRTIIKQYENQDNRINMYLPLKMKEAAQQETLDWILQEVNM